MEPRLDLGVQSANGCLQELQSLVIEWYVKTRQPGEEYRIDCEDASLDLQELRNLCPSA